MNTLFPVPWESAVLSISALNFPPSYFDFSDDFRQNTVAQVSTDKLSKVSFDELVLAFQTRAATGILLRGPDKVVGTDLGSSHHNYALCLCVAPLLQVAQLGKKLHCTLL